MEEKEKQRPFWFLSYSRRDSEFVFRIAKELKSKGIDIWLDQKDLSAGKAWDSQIEKALEECAGLLVVLSPDSVRSNNVLDEVSFAIEENRKMLPIVYRQCRIPFRLKRLQYCDFTSDYAVGMSSLLEQILQSNKIPPPLSVDQTCEYPSAVSITPPSNKTFESYLLSSNYSLKLRLLFVCGWYLIASVHLYFLSPGDDSRVAVALLLGSFYIPIGILSGIRPKEHLISFFTLLVSGLIVQNYIPTATDPQAINTRANPISSAFILGVPFTIILSFGRLIWRRWIRKI